MWVGCQNCAKYGNFNTQYLMMEGRHHKSDALTTKINDTSFRKSDDFNQRVQFIISNNHDQDDLNSPQKFTQSSILEILEYLPFSSLIFIINLHRYINGNNIEVRVLGIVKIGLILVILGQIPQTNTFFYNTQGEIPLFKLPLSAINYIIR